MTFVLLLAEVASLFARQGAFAVPVTVVDFCVSLPGLLALHLHIWDQKVFAPAFWKVYAFVFVAWDFAVNLWIGPAATSEKPGMDSLIGFILLLPLYFAVFRYAFRRWPESE